WAARPSRCTARPRRAAGAAKDRKSFRWSPTRTGPFCTTDSRAFARPTWRASPWPRFCAKSRPSIRRRGAELAAMSAPPTVSIVTICRNDAAGVGRTLSSVAAQDYPALEQIVVDGGSTDGTREVLERHRGGIAHLISETDRGISHAFNKGIAAAG